MNYLPCSGLTLAHWTRVVLCERASYLMTCPELTKKLSQVYEMINTRTSQASRMRQLYGKLDLMLSQVRRIHVVAYNSWKPGFFTLIFRHAFFSWSDFFFSNQCHIILNNTVQKLNVNSNFIFLFWIRKWCVWLLVSSHGFPKQQQGLNHFLRFEIFLFYFGV